MTAVVTLKPGETGRHYRLPTDADYAAVRKAQVRLDGILDDWERGGRQGPCPVPDEPLNPVRPSPNARGLSAVTRYSMEIFGDLYSARQKLAMATLGRHGGAAETHSIERVLTAMCVNKVAMQNCSVCRWKPTGESLIDAFGRQALPMVWDFAESIPIGGSTGGYESQMRWLAEATSQPLARHGTVEQADATKHPLPTAAAKHSDINNAA